MSYQIPESIDGLTREQLATAETEATAAFDALRDDESLNAEGMAQLRALATFIRSCRDGIAAIDAQSAADAAELAAMVNDIHPQASEEPEGEPAGDGDAEGGEGEGEPAEDAPADPVVVETATRTPVMASGQTVGNAAAQTIPAGQSLTRSAARAPRTLAPTAPKTDTILSYGGRPAVVTAAADLPDYANGHQFKTMLELAEALAKRWNGFPKQGRLRGTSGFARLHLKQGVARVQLPDPVGVMVADGRNDTEVIDSSASLARIGGSLLAAGAWCPPPEQRWDLCGSLIGVSGLWDGPRFTYRRNAVSYPGAINLIPLADDIGFVWDEAASTASPVVPKNCFTFPCVQFEDFEQTCNGICIRGDLINDTAWPELLQRMLGDAMALHQHVLNRDVIAAIAAAATPVSLTPGSDIDADTTVLSGLFSAIALAAADYRAREMTSDSQELEVLLPAFVGDMAAADQARRGFCCTPDSANAQAQLNSRLRGVNVRVQWLGDWQDGFAGATGGLGNTAPATKWPSTVKFVIYAPGTWSLGSRNIISLDAVYDSTSLQQNEYTSMFTEECRILVNRCHPTYIYTVDVCPSGATSAPVAFACATS